MKWVLAVVVIACVGMVFGSGSLQLSQEHVFVQFMSEFNKAYDSPVETFRRFAIFKENLVSIEAHNSQANITYWMGVGPFTDRTFHEFLDIMGLIDTSTSVPVEANLPAADIDWRTKGAVTAVKDQGNCGSCWAFGATGSLEGAFQIKRGNLVSFSEQQLIDCSGSSGNHGCDGGLPHYSYHWWYYNGGACTEAAYPYKAADLVCQTSCANVVGSKLATFAVVKENDEADLAIAVAKGPVAVGVSANSNWQNYKSGVFSDSTCYLTQLNHAVLAVGSKADATLGNSWILKNSWSPLWGEAGYMRLIQGKNMCGVASAGAYPVLA